MPSDPSPFLTSWETTPGRNLYYTHCRRTTIGDQLTPLDLAAYAGDTLHQLCNVNWPDYHPIDESGNPTLLAAKCGLCQFKASISHCSAGKWAGEQRPGRETFLRVRVDITAARRVSGSQFISTSVLKEI